MNEKLATKEDCLKQQKIKKKKNIGRIIVNIICLPIIFIVVFAAISILIAKKHNTMPSYFGFTIINVTTGSMESEGFTVGSLCLVKTVKPNELKVGDLIAYYKYDIVSTYVANTYTPIDSTEITETTKASNIFGYPSEDIQNAGAKQSPVIFHRIIDIRQNNKGETYFCTKGSSNPDADSYYFKADYVVGKYVDGSLENMSTISTMYKNKTHIFLIIVPILFMCVVMCIDLTYELGLAFIESQVMKGKISLFDEVCIKNEIGYKMSKRTKYKLLSITPEQDRQSLIPMLWKNADRPYWIQKYFARKNIMVTKYEKLNALKAECTQMKLNGKTSRTIMNYYNKQKHIITKEINATQRKIKRLRKKYDNV